MKVYDLKIISKFNKQVITQDLKDSSIKTRVGIGLKNENWNILNLEDNMFTINSCIRFHKNMVGVWDLYVME